MVLHDLYTISFFSYFSAMMNLVSALVMESPTGVTFVGTDCEGFKYTSTIHILGPLKKHSEANGIFEKESISMHFWEV